MKAPEIEIARWGKDHWSTFAYIETCAVEEQGVDADRMRTHPRLHLRCYQMKREMSLRSGMGDGSGYPTRLNDGTSVAPHDDWSCVEDMIAEGLLETAPHASYYSVGSQRRGPRIAYGQKCALCNPVSGLCDGTYKLTPKGFAIAHQLREHKANGGTFGNFKPSLEVESVAA